MEFCRTVPGIVFALIFVIAFGLGPMAGVLAIAIHCIGALGKQYAEMVENIDMKPVEGVRSTGASWLACMRFAVLPQVAAGFASYTLLRFEINVRDASVMGFVGAGGIGMELITAIRKFYYSDVSADSRNDHPDRLRARYRHRMAARPVVRQRSPDMTKLSASDSEGLRARYPDVFDRPVSARLALPTILLGVVALFAYGLVYLGFSPARMLNGLRINSAGSR